MGRYRLASAPPPTYSRQWPTRYSGRCAGKGSPWSSTTSTTSSRWASRECRANLDRILAVCEELGVPLALEKLEMNTEEGVLRLPEKKLVRLRGLLAQWSQRRSCRRQQLESLIGTLQHACRVVRPGKAFLRRMIDLLRTPGAPSPHSSQPRVPGGPAMVGDLRDPLEWSRYVPLRIRADGLGHLGRLRGVGLRGLVRVQLVLAGVAPGGAALSQRAVRGRGGGRCLGQALAGGPSEVVVRQLSGSVRCYPTVLPGYGHDVFPRGIV